MEQDIRQSGYATFIGEATGSLGDVGQYNIISYPLGKYDIKVKVTPNNEFVEIVEVVVNGDFLSQQQKINLQGFDDIEKFYVEE